jgi:hypothetical protein
VFVGVGVGGWGGVLCSLGQVEREAWGEEVEGSSCRRGGRRDFGPWAGL